VQTHTFIHTYIHTYIYIYIHTCILFHNRLMTGRDYFEGFLGLILLFLCLAVLSIISCTTFCVCRCAFDKCGSRHATQYYHSSQTQAACIGIFLIALAIGVAATIGWSANIMISQSFDNIFTASDNLADHGREWISFATSTYEIGKGFVGLNTFNEQSLLLNDIAWSYESSSPP
jgi:hypothetical protein